MKKKSLVEPLIHQVKLNYIINFLLICQFVCFECVTVVRIYYNLQRKSHIFRRIDRTSNMQKYVTNKFSRSENECGKLCTNIAHR